MKTLIYLIAFLPVILFAQNNRPALYESFKNKVENKLYSYDSDPGLKEKSNWEHIELKLDLTKSFDPGYWEELSDVYEISIGTQFEYSKNNRSNLSIGIGISHRRLQYGFNWFSKTPTIWRESMSSGCCKQEGPRQLNILLINTPILFSKSIFKIKRTDISFNTGLTPKFIIFSDYDNSDPWDLEFDNQVVNSLKNDWMGLERFTPDHILKDIVHETQLSIGLAARQKIGEDHFSVGLNIFGTPFNNSVIPIWSGLNLSTTYNF